MLGEEGLGGVDLLDGDRGVRAGVGVQALVLRADRLEQRERRVDRDELVVGLHEEQRGAGDVRGAPAPQGLPSANVPISPSTAQRTSGVAATNGTPNIVPIDRPQ